VKGYSMTDDNEPARDDPDLRLDDIEYDPEANPPRSAKAWINLLEESKTAFEKYNSHCDKIEQRYASLMRLADMTRDKEFQMFWANMETIKPEIYARPPVPVVTPKFKDRRPVPEAASELLERCCSVAFDLTRIDDLMKLVRNDLAAIDRGIAWVRYEGKRDKAGAKGRYRTERACIDFKNRLDFLHSLSRNWREVTWVAGAAYLTRKEARKRFKKFSGDEYQSADYKVDRDAKEVGGSDGRERAKFWEIWDKTSERVIWVAEGCENILDEDDPHIDFQNFFPCPQPAYGTCQPGSLVPVPDVLQYEDQLDELNLLTSRIHALSDALEAKGFYPAGTSEIAEAVQAAVAHNTPNRILVPISNWAAFGGTKDVIIWLPIDVIANTITQCVMLRKQIIDDIYQIVGLSDIMRGSTDPNETLGAQELKMQSGSVRVRDKQQEIVRLARDLVECVADIITDKFDPVTMIEMSQTDLQTQAMADQQTQALQSQLQQIGQMQQMANTPQGQQYLQQNPDAMGQVQQAEQQLQHQLGKIQRTPTLEQVLTFLVNTRSRAFVLDIETDSTIQLNEDAEKKARGEFLGMLSNLLPQLSAMITAEPSTAEFCGELLKFSVAPFRAGRSLDGAIDALVDQMKEKATMPPGDDPTTASNKVMLQIEQMKDATAQAKIKSDADMRNKEIAQKDAHKRMELNNEIAIERIRAQARGGDPQAKIAELNAKAVAARQEHAMDMAESQQKLALGQQKIVASEQAAQQKLAQNAQLHQDRRQQQAFKAMQPARPPGPVR
jgi:hypothetical protein